jgi:hypothetical protein
VLHPRPGLAAGAWMLDCAGTGRGTGEGHEVFGGGFVDLSVGCRLQAGYGVFTGGAVVAGCMVADRYKQLHGTYHGKALVDVSPSAAAVAWSRHQLTININLTPHFLTPPPLPFNHQGHVLWYPRLPRRSDCPACRSDWCCAYRGKLKALEPSLRYPPY